jgi:hypothetical protein
MLHMPFLELGLRYSLIFFAFSLHACRAQGRHDDGTPAPNSQSTTLCCTDYRQILALTFGCGWVVVGTLIVYLCLVRPMLSRRFGMPDPAFENLGQPRGAAGGETLQTMRRRFKLISAEKWHGPEGDTRRAEGWLIATVKMAREAEDLIRADIRLPTQGDPSKLDTDKKNTGTVELTVGLQDGLAELIEEDDSSTTSGEPGRTLRVRLIEQNAAGNAHGAAAAPSNVANAPTAPINAGGRQRRVVLLHGAGGVSTPIGETRSAAAGGKERDGGGSGGGGPQTLLITLPERIKCGHRPTPQPLPQAIPWPSSS